MNKLTKQIQRTWKSAQLYIGFHVDPKGRKRKTPKVWPPKNASATLHDDPLKQEADLLPRKVLEFGLVCSSTEETDDEEKPFQRRADHWDFEGASGWCEGG